MLKTSWGVGMVQSFSGTVIEVPHGSIHIPVTVVKGTAFGEELPEEPIPVLVRPSFLSVVRLRSWSYLRLGALVHAR